MMSDLAQALDYIQRLFDDNVINEDMYNKLKNFYIRVDHMGMLDGRNNMLQEIQVKCSPFSIYTPEAK